MNQTPASGPSYRPNQQQFVPFLRPQRPPRFASQFPLPYPRPRSSASKPNCSSTPHSLDQGLPPDLYETNHNRSFDSQSRFLQGGNIMDTSYDGNSTYTSEGDSSFATCLDTSFSARSDTSFNANTVEYDNNFTENNQWNNYPANSSFQSQYSFPNNYNNSGRAFGNNYQNSFKKSRTPISKFQKMQAQQMTSNKQGNSGVPFYPKKPVKRKAAAAEPDHRCDICNLDFTSRIPLEMHLRGSRHMKKVKGLETLKNLQLQGHAKLAYSVSNPFRCEACEVTLNGALQLQTHFDGTKHKNKIKELQSKMENILTSVEECHENGQEQPKIVTPLPESVTQLKTPKAAKLSCDTCGIIVNSQTQLLQHLGSKKHMAKVEGKPLPKKKRDKKQMEQDASLAETAENIDLEKQPNSESSSSNVAGTVLGVPPLSATFVQKGTLN